MNCLVLKMYHICTSFFTFVLGLVLSSHYDIVPTVALDTASTGCCGSKVKPNSNLYRNPSHPFSKEKGNEPLRLASSSITNLRSWTVVSNVTSSLILECRKSVSSWIKLLELLPKDHVHNLSDNIFCSCNSELCISKPRNILKRQAYIGSNILYWRQKSQHFSNFCHNNITRSASTCDLIEIPISPLSTRSSYHARKQQKRAANAGILIDW